SKTPTPSAGCFVALYPSAVWKALQCVAPPKERSVPSGSSVMLQPSTVGNTNDWVAQSPSGTLIGSSSGSFPLVSGLMSERDACVAPFLQQCGGMQGGNGANFYSLQDNTNFGFPVNYYGRSTTGWEQFLYANGGSSGVVYIEYWLLNYGSCPSASEDPPGGGVGWFASGKNCVFNTDGTTTPFVSPTNLSKLSLQTYADFGGYDEAMLCVLSGNCYAKSVTATVLNLYRQWTSSEFNVFGYDDGAQAQFSTGTTIAVRNVLFDGDANSIRTSCVSPPGFTGETNNLNLVSCNTSMADALSMMTFTETNAPIVEITVASSPIGWGYVTGSGYVSVDGVYVTTPETFSWIAGTTHALSAVSAVSCGVQCRYVFTGWSDQGEQTHYLTVPAYPTPTGLSFPTYTATYEKQYYLNVQPSGPGWINSISGWYNAGTTVTLTATPNPQHIFKSWSGTGEGNYIGTENPATIIMNGPISESAIFS
ncbi:MAG TPA: hypothetical protein VEI80_03130, partial [Candidatus Acidoferrales bacterium]|nr:hypothetical protein [Candidatus Acidoferrales bacterium]